MTMTEARELRDEIRDLGLWSTVPTGYGPNRYFAQLGNSTGIVRLENRDQWEEYRRGMEEREKERQKILHSLLNPPRSLIDAMIDKACGLG